MAMTIDEQYALVAQLGLIEGIRAGLLQDLGSSAASQAAVTALTPVSVANATDEASAVALANANKVAINAIIAALKA